MNDDDEDNNNDKDGIIPSVATIIMAHYSGTHETSRRKSAHDKVVQRSLLYAVLKSWDFQVHGSWSYQQHCHHANAPSSPQPPFPNNILAVC